MPYEEILSIIKGSVELPEEIDNQSTEKEITNSVVQSNAIIYILLISIILIIIYYILTNNR